jgi:glycosyltransferase involved in cell wall biosynthesis
MKTIHIHLGYTRGMSGGDECILNVARRFVERGIHSILLTTEGARRTFSSMGLCNQPALEYRTVPDFWDGRSSLSLLAAYIRRTRAALRLLGDLPIRPGDALYCCSGFFPNGIPFHRLAERHPRTSQFCWMHMLEPGLWRGFEGEYTGRISLPTPKRIRYILEQRLYRRLIPPNATLIAYNPIYRERLTSLLPRHPVYIIRRFGGARIPKATPGEDESTPYDIAWIGRFHEQKGLFDLVQTVKILADRRPDLRVLVMGGGDHRMERRFREAVARNGLQTIVDWKGVVLGDEKYKLLRKARIFLMPSSYESFGIVNLEAMQCGLPVVAFDLPVFAVFERGMVKVPIGNAGAMAAQTAALLDDPAQFHRLRREALDFAQAFSWSKTGDELIALLDQTPPGS